MISKFRCLRTASALLVALLVVGCATGVRRVSVSPPGNTFRGNTGAGLPLVVTLEPDDEGVRGFGSLNGRDFAVSGPMGWHGPAVLTFADGDSRPVYLTLAPNRASLEIEGLGAPLVLSTGGGGRAAGGGDFSGGYRSVRSSLSTVSLVLEQRGELLAGSGFVDGRPVAVVGRTTGPGEAEGTVVFADGSRGRLRATRSADGRKLTVEGLGGTVQLKRR